tara:strand:+ start:298 stop:924 length:627 start_codon:yes stop_codon:yes gene_type:complete
MRKPLTERQQAIFDYISTTIRSRNTPPTIRDIMEKFRINSTNGVRTTLAALEKKGHIRRHARLSRGIELVDYAEPFTQGQLREIPLLGRVAAGEPILATGNVESTLQIDQSLISTTGNVFALRVHGESMLNAGILNGDIVVARQQNDAECNDIVVALIDNEATVKRYAPDVDVIRLLPENDAFEPIVVSRNTTDFSIAGKVVGLTRQF